MKRSISRAFKSIIFFFLFTPLMSTVSLSQTARGWEEDSGKQDQSQQVFTERNSFSKPGPGGKWSLHVIFDYAQIDNDSVPVVVSTIKKFLGNKRWQNVKITGLTLDNRSVRPVKSVQIRWIITSELDRDAVVLQGLTLLFDAQIPAQDKLDVEPPVIDFADVTKPLQKKGTLKGEFVLRLRVSEVRFEDGYIWKDDFTAKTAKTPLSRMLKGQSAKLTKTAGRNTSYRALTTPLICSCQNTDCLYVNGYVIACAYDGGGANCHTYSCTPEYGCNCSVSVCAVNCCPYPPPGDSCYEDEVWDPRRCFCRPRIGSPVIIDVLGDGYKLTDIANGVMFDLNVDGFRDHVGWTEATSDDAFLALDRDGNGKIDNGLELFGNFTPQPAQSGRNGFIALSEYDKAENGGNGDGTIDKNDAVFSSLRLWQDVNHNGNSESNELHPFKERGVKAMSLNYKESRRVDSYGNEFRYRAKVHDTRNSNIARWAWDVFLVMEP